MSNPPVTPMTRRSLLAWWRDLSINLKLLIPIIVVAVIFLSVLVFFLGPTLNRFLNDNIRLGFDTYRDQVNQRLGDIFDDAQFSIVGLVNSTEVRRFVEAQSTGTVENADRFRSGVEQLLISSFATRHVPFADLRFLSTQGDQLIRVRASSETLGSTGVAMLKESFIPEANEPYFSDLQTLKEGQVYISLPEVAEPIGKPGAKTDLAFQVAVPAYFENKIAGYIIGSYRPARFLVEALSPSPFNIYSFNTVILDQQGKPFIVADPRQQPQVLVRGDPAFMAPEIPALALSGQEQELTTIGDRQYSVLTFKSTHKEEYANAPFRFVISKSTADVPITGADQIVNLTITRGFLLAFIIIVLVGFMGQSVVRPLARLTQTAQKMAQGEFATRAIVTGNDEIGQLSTLLNDMSARLQDLFTTLEARVKERTRNIEIVAEISREAAQVHSIDDLLQLAVESIRDRFGFYHAQVFLIDDVQEYAVLHTSTGDAGRALLNMNHRLAIGSNSIVGQVTLKRRPFVTLDTQQSEVPHRFNPLLPRTRSEIALPLMVSDTLIGALDIQSVEQDAFKKEDVQIFQVLADQLAIAINNAQLIEEQAQRAEQIAQLNRQLTRDAWSEYVDRESREALAYQYDLSKTTPGDRGMGNGYGETQAVKAPITIRGETIGTLTVSEGTGLPLSNEERAIVQAVAERVSLAVENIRLVQQTQSALARVEQLYQASRELGSVSGLEEAYSVLAQLLAGYAFVDRVVIMLARPDPVRDYQYLEYVHVWDRNPKEENFFQARRRVPRAATPAKWLPTDALHPVLADLEHDLDDLPQSKAVFEQMGIKSLLLAPLATPARWFGLLLVHSERVNAFNENFIQFVGALGDQAAIAFENYYLFAQTQAEARRNRALAEAAQIVSQIGIDFETGVENLIRTVAPAANYDRWWFGQVILAPSGIVLRRVAARFVESSPLNRMATISLERDRHAIAEVARTGNRLVVNDPLTHPAFQGQAPNMAEAFGKHIAVPVRISGNNVGILMVGRSLVEPDMTERDVELVATLVSQMAVVLENQRLFNAAQHERETLQSVMNSLPAAVVVVDAATNQIALTNEQARALLGMEEMEPYQLVRTSTGAPLADDELPTRRALDNRETVAADDVTIIDTQGNRTDVLVSAVPIFQDDELRSAVAVYQDVTELRELENVLQESLRETTTLYEISRAIASENELAGILRVLGEQLHTLLAADYLFAIFCDEQGIPTRAFGGRDDGTGIVMEALDDPQPMPESVLRKDENFVDSDIRENPDLNHDPKLLELGIISLNVFPLSARGRVIGWLVIAFTDDRAFPPEQRRTLGNMADQAAVAIESARLAEETAQSLTTTSLLYEAGLSISRAESLENTLEVIRDQLQYFEPDQADIILVNERKRGRTLDWVVHWDAFSDYEQNGAIETESPAPFEDIPYLEADSLFVDDVRTAPFQVVELLRELPNWGQFTAHASVPLLAKGRVAGRLAIFYRNPYKFGRTEQQVISALADQGAIAIDNFLLVQQTQESLDETAILYQTSRNISNAVTVASELDAIVNYAAAAHVNGAILIRLLSPSWTQPDASILIETSWHEGEEGVDLTGIRFTPDQFPAWPEISLPEMFWISDLDDPEHPPVHDEDFYRIFGFRSFVMIPLTTAGRPVGALLLGASSVWLRNERQMRIYASLADLIAISMERQRLLEYTERRAAQLETSATITRAATSILNLDELFGQTVNLIKEGFGYDHVQVFRITPDGKDAKAVASTGEAGKQLLARGHSLPIGSRSVIGQVTATGLAQIVSDTTVPNVVHKPNPYLPKTRAEMALPLTVRDQILGALDVQSNEPGAFTYEDVTALSTLADQIAIAINNAELFEISNRRVEEMRFLFDATRVASNLAQETEATATEIAQLVLENLNVAATTVLLLDDAETRLVPYSAAQKNLDMRMPQYYDFSTPFFQAFAQAKEPMLVNDVPAMQQIMQTSRNLGQSRLLQQFSGLLPNAGSLVLMPLVSAGKFLGILAAAKQEFQGFNDDSMRLLQTLSSTLSAIIQNARLLRDVQQANVRLMELDKVKNQFLANMSHELRTPLNSIIGFSRVILKGIDGPLTEMQEQDLTTIYESGKHLLGLVNDILDQAKIEADKMEFSNDHFSIVDLIKGVMSTAVGLVKDKQIRLHQEIEGDLPRVWGDEFRTRQALLNLVSNAAKFTQQGSITVSAFILEEEGQPFVQVSVTDTGIGIPADKVDAIFEPFQQAENSAARQYEGTGLGLPIAKKLIEKQGGRIWVTSEVGIGSTFSFTMPCNRKISEDAGEEQPQAVE